jgi:hypothetical protein
MNKSKRMIWAQLVECMGEMINSYKYWSDKLKRRDDSEVLCIGGRIIIRMDLREIIWELVDWMHLPQYMDQWRALVNTVMNLRLP